MVKNKKSRKNKAKIGLCVAVILIIAGAVFVGLFFVTISKDEQTKKTDYARVRAKVQELVDGRKETEKFLNLKIESAKLNEKERKIVDEFEKIVPGDDKVQKVLQGIKDICSDDDEAIGEIVNKVALSYIHLRALYLLEKDMSVMYDGELSDEDLKVLGESDYEYLVKMAKDINDYREKVKKLSTKDNDFEKGYNTLVEEGKKLSEKYATVKFEDIVGVKKEDILAYYDEVDELNKILLEQEQK